VSARNLNFAFDFFKWRFSDPNFAFLDQHFVTKNLPENFSTAKNLGWVTAFSLSFVYLP